jgi:4'-phosphopantetheinyl transferase
MNRVSPDIKANQIKLTAGDLHVWMVDLDTCDANGWFTCCRACLSAEERERARSFLSARQGERWARSRALLRSLAGSYLGADPAELCFQLGEHGKPRLASTANRAAHSALAGAELHFNLSHSGGYGLYVFALDCEVGCDIERGGRAIDMPAVAERAWGHEMAERLRSLDGERREREFLRAWVRHEASLKCAGLGLAGLESGTAAARNWVSELELDGAVGAVAAAAPPAKISHRSFVAAKSSAGPATAAGHADTL